MTSERRARRRGAAVVAVLAGVVAGGAIGALALPGILPGPAAVNPPAVTVSAAAPEREPAASPPPIPDTQFTVVAAGDVLPHQAVTASATSGGAIDYSPLTAAVRPYIEGADIALCHMEVPLAPAGTSPTGYPMFGAPSELARDLADDGWDGCSTASNHSVDKAAAGIATTLAAFDSLGMGSTGTARSEAEAATTMTYTVHGAVEDITVAHISYAYGLNGLNKPSGQPWAVNTFDANAPDASPIIAAARQARDEGADIVIASVHCCVEYQTAPTAAQRALAQQIADSGLVDLYIGHHAHVPQPIELLPGGPGGNGMWTAFGLGNFISNQDAACCKAETANGVLLTATFTIAAEGDVGVAVEWTGITVDRRGGHAVSVLATIPNGSGSLSAAEVQARHALVAAAVGGSAPERTAPPVPLAYGVEAHLRSAA